MIESTHDCGHPCCGERANPFHDHFLSAEDCGSCERLRDLVASAKDLRAKIRAVEGDADLVDRCSHCSEEKPDRVGLSLLETDDLEAEDFGFCSVPCLMRFLHDRYMETS